MTDDDRSDGRCGDSRGGEDDSGDADDDVLVLIVGGGAGAFIVTSLLPELLLSGRVLEPHRQR